MMKNDEEERLIRRIRIGPSELWGGTGGRRGRRKFTMALSGGPSGLSNYVTQ